MAINRTGFGIPAHWWGKIIGAFLGLLRGGLMGALVGALLGHFFDRFLAGLRGQRHTRDVFFRTLFASLGHINKADGRVTKAEIHSAEQLMTRLQLTPEERQQAIHWFNRGKQQDFDLNGVLGEFARYAALRPDLRQILVEILIDGAMADGRLSEAERNVLVRVCAVLHIPANILEAMLSAHRMGGGQGGWSGRSGGQSAPSLSQAYATLGIAASASPAEVKKAYRKLIGQYHPDRLVSRGLPEEMMEKAKTRVRDINAAYDQIKLARGIK